MKYLKLIALLLVTVLLSVPLLLVKLLNYCTEGFFTTMAVKILEPTDDE